MSHVGVVIFAGSLESEAIKEGHAEPNLRACILSANIPWDLNLYILIAATQNISSLLTLLRAGKGFILLSTSTLFEWDM